jgi:hypothetical protein
MTREEQRRRYLTMRFLHLTEAQDAAIDALIQRFGDQRPEHHEYEKALTALGEVDGVKVPKFRIHTTPFKETVPGFHSGEVVPSAAFDARQHLPPGVGLYSMYDSGGNCRVSNAATIAWTLIWNCWPSSPEQKKNRSLYEE